MKIKRFLKLVLISVLAFVSLFAAACNLDINFPSGCGGNDSGKTTTVEPVIIEDNSGTEFSMTMVERRSFYYPTIAGKVNLDFYPTKLEAIVDGKESFVISEDDYTNLSFQGNKYIVSFSKEHIFGGLKKGDYRVTLKAYNADKPYLVNYEATLVADDDYFAISAICDFFGDENELPIVSFVSGMDKESNWAGPY